MMRADFRSQRSKLDPVTCRAAPRGPRTPASTSTAASRLQRCAWRERTGGLGVAVLRVGRQRTAVVIVKLETVVAHRQGFRLFGTWKVAAATDDRPSAPMPAP